MHLNIAAFMPVLTPKQRLKSENLRRCKGVESRSIPGGGENHIIGSRRMVAVADRVRPRTGARNAPKIAASRTPTDIVTVISARDGSVVRT